MRTLVDENGQKTEKAQLVMHVTSKDHRMNVTDSEMENIIKAKVKIAALTWFRSIDADPFDEEVKNQATQVLAEDIFPGLERDQPALNTTV